MWDAQLGKSFFLPGVLQGQPAWVRCPAALRAPLLTLFWANDLDQVWLRLGLRLRSTLTLVVRAPLLTLFRANDLDQEG